MSYSILHSFANNFNGIVVRVRQTEPRNMIIIVTGGLMVRVTVRVRFEVRVRSGLGLGLAC